MFGTNTHVPGARDRAAEAAKQVLHDGRSSLEHALNGVLRHANQAHMPALVHGLVISFTGNRQAAKKAERATAKALRKGTRSLTHSQGHRPTRTKWVVALAVLGGAAAAAVLVWSRLPHHEEPAQTTHPPHQPEGLAGGMSP